MQDKMISFSTRDLIGTLSQTSLHKIDKISSLPFMEAEKSLDLIIVRSSGQ